MRYWIISSNHSRDKSTGTRALKWAADTFLKTRRFYPAKRRYDFEIDDLCLLKVFGWQVFIGNFRISSSKKIDSEGDIFYEIDNINNWDYPLDQRLLPKRYKQLLPKRSTSIEVTEEIYRELIGVRNFTQNLRIDYKNRVRVQVSERELEDLLDAKNALRSIGLEIVERQLEVTPGNIIDLLCKDSKGDYVVVELKRHSANETVGQLARYVTDVRENIANTSQRVRGLILALDIDEQLVKAARGVDFDVVLYQLIIG